MSIATDKAHAPAPTRQVDATRLLSFLASPKLTFGLALVAIAQQMAGHLDCDVSWFITFAEKVANGAVPYVDVTDPNPPLVFLSLTPAISLARLLHVAVEPVVSALVFLFAALSIGLSALTFRFGLRRSRADWMLLLNSAVFLLLIAPEIAFAEREHLALLALAPALTVMGVAAEGGRPPLWLRILAGVVAGVAFGFKPQFALGLALPALGLAWRERSLRALSGAELWAAIAVFAAQILLLFALYPAYRELALPLIVDVYAPARDTWVNLALYSLGTFNLVLLAGLALAAARGHSAPPMASGLIAPAATWVAAFASAGFLLGFFVQGKGWINHAYPGFALALVAWIFFTLDRHPRASAARDGYLFKFLFLPALIAAPALFAGANQIANVEEHPGLAAAVARVAPEHPRVIAMARQLDFGHPVTRQLGGTWVGRPNALWVSSFVAQLLPGAKDEAARQRLLAYRHRDLDGFARDVRLAQPDVVIVEDKPTRDYVEKQPETAHVLEGYEKTAAVDAIEIWTRRPQEFRK
jgi:hypothetical protein